MQIWVMAEDKEERTTRLTVYYKPRSQASAFVREQDEYHRRNGVRVKFIKWPPDLGALG